MAKEVKSTINYMTGIEGVSRKFALRRNTCTNKNIGENVVGGNHKIIGPTKFLGGSVRTKYISGFGKVQRNYLFMRLIAQDTTAKSALALKIRSAFAMAAQSKSEIMNDLSQIATLVANWKIADADHSKRMAGVSAAGYDMPGWVFAIQFARFKNNDWSAPQNYDTFPTQFDA